MATGLNSDNDEVRSTSLLDCPICLEGFINPKQLPCLHTFCKVCLEAYVKSCQNILTLDEVAESVSSGKWGGKILENLSALNKEVQKLIGNKKRQIENIKTRKESLIKQSENTIDSAIAKLQRMKLELRDGLSRECSLETKPFEMQIESFDWFHENISQNISYLTNVNDRGNCKHVFVTLQKINNCLQVQRDQFLKFTEDSDNVFIDVAFDKSVEIFLRNTQKPFEITSKHSKGWTDNAKTNVLQRFANLDKFFINMTDTNQKKENVKDDQILGTEDYEDGYITSEQDDSDSSENEDGDVHPVEDIVTYKHEKSSYNGPRKQKKKDKRDSRRRKQNKLT